MINDLILKAILGTLSPEEAEELRIWREADEANEQLYQQTVSPEFLQGEWAKMQGISHARPLAEMQARIGGGSRRSKLRPFLLGAAASLVVTLLVGALAYLYLNNRSARDIQVGSLQATLQVIDGEIDSPPALPVREGAVTTQELLADYRAKVSTPSSKSPSLTGEGVGVRPSLALTTPRGGEFRVTLEDGTEVWLNAQSRLVYPETFAGDERRVQVEGEAYFRVARDEQKPFLVETDGQLIRVLGTEFNVHSYAEDKAVETTLVKGSIAMQPIGAGDAQLVLKPGHQAVFDKEAHNMNVRSADTEVVTSWKDGKFVFENQTLRQIMLTLSRWYDFDYEFLDEKAATTVFMGRIPRYSDFDDVIAILESSGGLKVSVKGKTVIVKSEK